MIALKRRPARPELDNAGFTLLEIIAVIVILSILAVVAVPRYFDLQSQARDKAMKTAMAEGMGRINGFFAQQLLSGSTPGEINYDNPALAGNMQDFSLTITDGAPNTAGPISITVQGLATAVLNMTMTKTVRRPGM